MKRKGELGKFEKKEEADDNPEITASALTNFERKISVVRNRSATA